MAMVLSMSLFSLAGLPIFSGFATKFYLFTSVADAGFLWIVIIAMVSSVISLYYYLMVIKQMYVAESDETAPLRLTVPITGALVCLLGAVILFGVYPGPLLDLIEDATRALPL